MRTTFFLCLITSMLCLASAPAWAHRVNIFAYVDGGDILVECGFNRSQKVRQGQIEVFDAATGDMLLRGTTDDQGQFRFPIPPQARQSGHDLRIHINAGEGHQNDWTVAAAEFAAASAAPPVPPTGETSAAPGTPGTAETAPGTVSGGTATGAATPADVERIVNTALDAKLAPVKRMLAEQFEAGPGLREIIGGIGWIFGIVGVAAYFKRRG